MQNAEQGTQKEEVPLLNTVRHSDCYGHTGRLFPAHAYVRARLPNGRVLSAVSNKDVPARGSVPGGRASFESSPPGTPSVRKKPLGL